MALSNLHCPNCQSQNGKTHTSYKVLSGKQLHPLSRLRQLFFSD